MEYSQSISAGAEKRLPHLLAGVDSLVATVHRADTIYEGFTAVASPNTPERDLLCPVSPLSPRS